jgi:hypothetical protein
LYSKKSQSVSTELYHVRYYVTYIVCKKCNDLFQERLVCDLVAFQHVFQDNCRIDPLQHIFATAKDLYGMTNTDAIVFDL